MTHTSIWAWIIALYGVVFAGSAPGRATLI